jgi:hypothetical protein
MIEAPAFDWLEVLMTDPEPRPTPLTEANGARATAVVLGVRFGQLLWQQTNGHTSGDRTLQLRVEPDGEPPYEAELVLGPGEPMVPAQPGTRLPVLVDPDDPRRLALPADRWFVLPGGILWPST